MLPPASPSPVYPPTSMASSLQLLAGLAARPDSAGCGGGAGCSAESCTASALVRCTSPAAPPCAAGRAPGLPSPYLHLLGHLRPSLGGL